MLKEQQYHVVLLVEYTKRSHSPSFLRVWIDTDELQKNWTLKTASLVTLIDAAWFDTMFMMCQEKEYQLLVKIRGKRRGLNQKQVLARECHTEKRRAEFH